MKFIIRSILIFCIILSSLKADAQDSFSIRGRVYSAQDSLSLINASAAVFSVSDSTLIKGTASNVNGYFSIIELPAASYLLNISYTGFSTYSQWITIQDQDIQLGTIYLDNTASILSEFEIKEMVTPVEILGDTTKFN